MNKNFELFLNNLYWGLPLFLTIVFFDHIFPILVLLSFAIALSIILYPITKGLDSITNNYKASATITILLFIVTLIMIINHFVPILYSQILKLENIISNNSFPITHNNFLKGLMPEFLYNYFNSSIENFNFILEQIWQTLVNNYKLFLQTLGSVALKMGSVFISFIFVIVFTTIILIERKKFEEYFKSLIPTKHHGVIMNIYKHSLKKIYSYLVGQLMVCGVIALLTMVALFMVNLSFGINIGGFGSIMIIGLIAGLCNIIPFLGPFIGAFTAVITYLIFNWQQVQFLELGIIIVTFIIIQMLDNFFVSPKIISKHIGLHPLIVIVGIMLGGSIGGSILGPLGIVLGMLLIIPFISIIKLIINESSKVANRQD